MRQARQAMVMNVVLSILSSTIDTVVPIVRAPLDSLGGLSNYEKYSDGIKLVYWWEGSYLEVKHAS